MELGMRMCCVHEEKDDNDKEENEGYSHVREGNQKKSKVNHDGNFPFGTRLG